MLLITEESHRILIFKDIQRHKNVIKERIKMKEDIPKRKPPFFFIFNSLSNKQQLLLVYFSILH